MKTTDEVYPNQPLIEVVFEVRFPGEVRVNVSAICSGRKLGKSTQTYSYPIHNQISQLR